MNSFAVAKVLHRYPQHAEQIFDAFLDPTKLGQWMFGPNVREEEVIRLNVLPRIGGSFSFLVRRDGKDIEHVGEYTEIRSPSRLAFTWGVKGEPTKSLVEVDIVGLETGSEVLLQHKMGLEYSESVPKIENSWQQMLTALNKHVV